MEDKKASCADCGAPYGEDGWCDVVIPDEIWNQLNDNMESGLLCFRCMTKRLESAGLDNVPVLVASGPYRDANEEWRMIGWNHGYKVGKSEVESPPVVEGELTVCEGCEKEIPDAELDSAAYDTEDGVWLCKECKPEIMELLPCPFCGKKMEADEVDIEDLGSGPPPQAAVICGHCGAKGPGGFGRERKDYSGAKEAAKTEWNTRQKG